MRGPDSCDLIVIGAGIHGAGVAQAAAAAGHRVLVLERTAPAAGTSSRSSKLIHGGLRYLENGQFGLEREALRERALLLRNAPELVRWLPFHLPVYEDSARGALKILSGLMFYALFGGRGYARIDPRRWDNPDGLETKRLRAVFRYFDAQTNDAELTRAVLNSAIVLGAEFICPAEVMTVRARAQEYEIDYVMGGRLASCLTRAVVNAAGPWINHVLRRIEPPVADLKFDRVQGAHLVLDASIRSAYYVEAEDRRGVFMLPWQGGTLLGTTETSFDGDPDSVSPTREEMDYLLACWRRHFPAREASVLESFAGVRVLPNGEYAAFSRSREAWLVTNSSGPPGLVSICGGKLTTYRATAERVMRLLKPVLPAARRVADTRVLRIEPAG